jgi:4-oxalocrotonate tautomerase
MRSGSRPCHRVNAGAVLIGGLRPDIPASAVAASYGPVRSRSEHALRQNICAGRYYSRISQSAGAGVQRAMVESIAVPEADCFQVVSEHSDPELIFSPRYLGIAHSDRFVLVQIVMSYGRKPQQKRKLFKRIAETLAESPGVPPQDVMITIVETSWENWSFGNGEAQYMDT